MALPIPTSYPPMEARPACELPKGPNWHYEPKWDGFRCVAFRDSHKITLQSKSGKPLTRYFPELAAALLSLKVKQFVLDGEIVIPIDGQLSFDDLLERIHPAASRIAKLSQQKPGLYVVFDLLVGATGRNLTRHPQRMRREHLEAFFAKYGGADQRMALSPATSDLAKAKRWFQMGVGLDGIVAKRDDLPYQSGNRTGMQKIKKQRTADCVVGGFRYLDHTKLVGSLLLGLYDERGKLDHVGFSSSIHDKDRRALTEKLEKLVEAPGFSGKAPGGPSRWSTKRSSEWEPLRPKLVAEVAFDHFTGGRFRHGTRFVRWRPDKAPKDCTSKQVKRECQSALGLL